MGYQQVEYIYSNDGQVITLDYIVQEDDVITLKFQQKFQNGDKHVCMASDGTTGVWFNLATTGFYYRFGGSTSMYYKSEKDNYAINNITIKKGEGKINDEITIKLPYTKMPQVPLNIFAGKHPTTGEYYAFTSVYLYSFCIMNGGIKKIELIPCYRKSDGEIGLYDTINNIFYTNLGTGEFLKGTDI